MVTYLTGYSGSGKSTICKRLQLLGVTHVKLDELTKYLMNPSYFDKMETNIIKKYIEMYYTDECLSKTSWQKDPRRLHSDFLRWLDNQEGEFIVEGVHFFTKGYIDEDVLFRNEIIIVNQSQFMSLLKRIKRGWSHKERKMPIRLGYIFKYDIGPFAGFNKVLEMKQFKKNCLKHGIIPGIV